jgi:phospholipid N-methyltransferase
LHARFGGHASCNNLIAFLGHPMTTSPELPTTDDLQSQLHQFDGLWRGGYYEGDPLDPLSASSYQSIGYMSVLHATYLCCVKPFVDSSTTALEIGPGRGAWTRAILAQHPREVWCLDALSREHNGFDEYVGRRENVHYFQVKDFLCNDLPDEHFDFLFSFGCFCHLSPTAIQEYLRNLHPKLKSGAHAFVLVADYDKYNRAVTDPIFNAERIVLMTPRNVVRRLWNRLASAAMQKKYPRSDWYLQDKNQGPELAPGRFYHAGASETSIVLRDLGYEVLDEDVSTVFRDPIIHFRRP